MVTRWPLPSCLPCARGAGRLGGSSAAVGLGGVAEPVDVGGAAVAVDGQDDREADADLGGGDGDREEGEGLAGVEGVAVRSQTSKATRLRLTALSMSSTDIRTRIALRRARTP